VTELAARARGLSSRLVPEAALRDVENARDSRALAAAHARAGAGADPAAPEVDRVVYRARTAELGVLARWAAHPTALAAIELDEDRRSLRAIARGIVAGVAPERRLAGAVATSRLPDGALAELAAVPTFAALADGLAGWSHPFSRALAGLAPGELVELETALARAFVEHARDTRDTAAREYVAAIADLENVAALVAVRARGRELAPAHVFLDGGGRLAVPELVELAGAPEDECRDRLARAFAGTPVATAIASRRPAALEDAGLAWQLERQARLRRREPHGMAAALYFVLRRRDEARRLRRAAWRIALGAPT
jgi:vacuolar-type H+-ATPase subunit C/Vma6